ncbi:MAG: hypothetical protein ABID83_00060 [Candidatus Omnitrophota bacterium]
MKKLAFIVLVFIAVVVGVLYVFRFDIFQYSAETIIKKNLPAYVKVDSIIFNLEKGTMEVNGLGIKNPKGYHNKFLATIKTITCRYKMKGKNILDGIEVTEIIAQSPVINIERRADGKLNVNDMDQVMASGNPEKGAKEKAVGARFIEPGKTSSSAKQSFAGKNISDLIKLTDTINIKDGEVVFLDAFMANRPYKLAFEGLIGNLVIRLNDDYSRVLSMASQGRGFLEGDRSQQISWVVSLDPTAKELTMSNRYEISNIDILLFSRYYAPYSPIVILGGRCSGTLVFDFDHGNIGSTNTLVVRGLRFRQQAEGSGYGFWQSDIIPQVINYLQSNPDEVTFDFKIKGTIENPQFYPGPYVKAAIQAVVVDKVSETIRSLTQEGSDTSDAGKVVDVIKGLLNK